MFSRHHLSYFRFWDLLLDISNGREFLLRMDHTNKDVPTVEILMYLKSKMDGRKNRQTGPNK